MSDRRCYRCNRAAPWVKLACRRGAGVWACADANDCDAQGSPAHEESRIELYRRLIEEQYFGNPTGCGGSFGELLCWELHTNGLTFTRLAEKWGVSLPTLGALIADHCDRLEILPRVNHNLGGAA